MKKSNLRILNAFLGSNKGFTLLEMAIVLVIIGIIIGAVVKGKDLVRGSEQKKLYSTFVNAWNTTYNIYYDRTGWILGDSDTRDNEGSRDGRCSNASEANLISQLKRIGVDTPSVGSTNSTITRTYTDSNGRQATIQLSFRYHSAHGNHIRMDALPNELGIAWDKMIDGQVDGASGSFLYVPATSSITTVQSWPSAQDQPLSSSAAIWKLTF